MIPAVLAAQFAKPLVKWGAIIGGIVLLLVAIWFHGRSSGKAVVQQAWDAAITKQAQESAEQVMAEAQMANEVLKVHAEESRDLAAHAAPVRQEVARYESAKPCNLDAEFVRLFDAVSSLSEPRQDSLSAADPGSREPEELSSPELQAAPVVQDTEGIGRREALMAYYDVVEYAMYLYITYAALDQFDTGRYIVHQTQRENEQQ